MSDLLPETTADLYDYTEPEPLRHDRWLVIAYNTVGGGGWNMPSSLRRLFDDRAAAEAAAEKLPDGWKFRKVVRIPGNKQ